MEAHQHHHEMNRNRDRDSWLNRHRWISYGTSAITYVLSFCS